MCASLCGGESLSREVSVQGVSVKRQSLSRGGLCPGGLCPGGLCQGGLCPGRGLCQGGSLSRGRSLSMGVFVRETPPYSKERPVRILLECILVAHMFSEHMVDKITGITRQVQRRLTPRSRWRYTGVRGPLSFFTAR